MSEQWNPYGPGLGAWLCRNWRPVASYIPSGTKPGKFYGIVLHSDIHGYFNTEQEAMAWCEDQLKENTKEI